jgi:sugar phosphate isomerase/epimerase
MLKILSTHLFQLHRLHPGLLEFAHRSGAEGVEIYAARPHFDYTRREDILELASWFRSNPLVPFSMHAPIFPEGALGRSGAMALNLVSSDKSQRIEAMDEIKRALEAAEHIPMRNLVVHLGDKWDNFSPQTLEFSLTALEHLGAFARPLGVRVLVENLTSDHTAPQNLMTILETGHLDSIGVCLDLGHAHMTVGVQEAIAAFGKRITTVHAHDNHGVKDEHLWPGDGAIDWPQTMAQIKAAAEPEAIILEIDRNLYDPATAQEKVGEAFEFVA